MVDVSAVARLCAGQCAAVAVILAVNRTGFGGDGWESNPPRTPHSAPQTVLKTAESTSSRTSPASGMLFGQRDADALDPEVFRMPGQQADQEAQHPIDLRAPGDGGDKRRLGGAKRAQLALLGDPGEAPRPGRDECDPDPGVALPRVDEREGTLAPDLPRPDLLAADPALQRAQKPLPTRVLAGVDRDLHARTIASFPPAGRT